VRGAAFGLLRARVALLPRLAHLLMLERKWRVAEDALEAWLPTLK
jgi:hypothetical protein